LAASKSRTSSSPKTAWSIRTLVRTTHRVRTE
jgi:hypothetical protein